jgi:putative SOS response-associated peptidase YedK
MCNLYRMTRNVDEVALWFDAIDAVGGANFASEVYPGYPGLVIADGQLRQMNWGFPLQMKGKSGQPLKPRPVNNTRTDKLDSFFWRYSFEERRCLIPVTAWAEAEGAKGRKTRTWFARPDAELIAVAGIWRSSEEWGEVYSMVMTDSAGVAAQCHDRMPVILAKPDWEGWTGGSAARARALCVPWTGPLEMDRTPDPWTKRS